VQTQKKNIYNLKVEVTPTKNLKENNNAILRKSKKENEQSEKKEINRRLFESFQDCV
jgi:hypothetical protein